ncbi:ABC transporter substrate-binding protein [Rhizobium puerariae]|uniref:ABC transporter substrate-binding protein n=1 Tax=Rhizobium puerariae TaxID=1585791 RepID=A0ABV6AN28_9HYPH
MLTNRRDLLKLSSALALVAGAGLNAPMLAQSSATLVYATGTDASSLDPQFSSDLPTIRMVRAIHETLVSADKGEIEGVLATEWSVGEDKTTWTFKLRPNVKFHDGTPFTSKAVKYSFERLVDPATGSPHKSSGNIIASIDTPDDLTVVIRTSSPFAPFLAQLTAYSMSILSPSAASVPVKEYGQKPIGTGAFKLGSWTPGEKLTLVANDAYWGTKPKLGTVEVRVVPEDSARVLMLLSGQAHVVSNIPPALAPRVESTANAGLLREQSFRSIYVAMNVKMEPFDDIKVRQAISLAIDKDALIKGVMRGMATASGSFDSPTIAGSVNYPLDPFDLAKAKQLLAEAGYPDGFSTDFYIPTGRYTNDRQLGEAIQAQLARVGIKVNLVSPEFATYQAMLRGKDKIAFYMLGKGNSTGDLDFTLNLVRRTGGSINYNNYSNPKVDELIAQQRIEVNAEKRNAMLKDIQELMQKDFGSFVLFYDNQIYGVAKSVGGLEVYPNEFINFANASLKA